jgi:cobyrinic acid a,c-diamide synthase
MAESAGAIVRGFVSYSPIHPFTDSPIRIAGVVFNRVASDNHFKRLKDSVQDVIVLGYLPRELNFEIPHRHLGLTVAEETPIAKENIAKLADSVLEHIDVDSVIKHQSIKASKYQSIKNSGTLILGHSDTKLRIAIAYDKAFCFYYEDNLDLLRDAGAEIITFSPLSDSAIPDKADAIYIGGGYPELYAKELSKNTSMMESINGWAISGKPIYAECGGLMYLSKGIYDFDGKFFEMARVFPFETEMKKGRSHLGYREILLKENCILGKKDKRLRGHEFHYSEIVKGQAEGSAKGGIINKIYFVRGNSVNKVAGEGYKFKNTLASYIHIHFGSNSEIARNFLNHIREQKWKA